MKKVVIFSGLLWALLVIAGMSILYKYSFTPGVPVALKGDYWPKNSQIERSEKPILLVFAHPYCPCSTATVNELERLMPTLENKVQVLVVFVQPKNQPRSWVQSSTWNAAKKIPGVKVMSDFDYRETDIFGAKTSGQVLFYDTDGLMLYSGGITPSRGHMGDSTGRDKILAWAEGKKINRETASVFGCSLREKF